MRLFVSVGTDTHPFERLVGWALDWAAEHPDDELLLQHGTTPLPAVPRGSHVETVALLDGKRMATELAAADAVVISAGPGGVMDARAAGRLPVAVARRGDLGEHVDDHQLSFVRHLQARGLARCIEDEAGFRSALAEVVADPSVLCIEPDVRSAPGVGAVGRLVDELVWGGPDRSDR